MELNEKQKEYLISAFRSALYEDQGYVIAKYNTRSLLAESVDFMVTIPGGVKTREIAPARAQTGAGGSDGTIEFVINLVVPGTHKQINLVRSVSKNFFEVMGR